MAYLSETTEISTAEPITISNSDDETIGAENEEEHFMTLDVSLQTEITLESEKILNKRFGTNETEITWWWPIDSKGEFDVFCNQLDVWDEFRDVEFDFENYYYAISVGRKLDKIIYTKEQPPNNPTDGFFAEPKHGMDTGHFAFPDYDMVTDYKNRAYIYKTDKVTFYDPLLFDFYTDYKGYPIDAPYSELIN